MKVLVACEESQEVCKAFREREGMRRIRATFWNVLVGILSGIYKGMYCHCWEASASL